MVAAVRQRISWLIMGVFAILLIVIGFEGSLGKCLGCIFTPGLIVVGNGTGSGTPTPTWQNPVPPSTAKPHAN
jgi:hypothetical protein